MVYSVANVWVPVRDIERALGFYTDVLGLETVKQDGDWVEVRSGGLNIGLNGREPHGAASDGGPVITFEPEDGIESAKKDLESKGVSFATGISDHEWGRVATFRDSEGNELQLYEPPTS